jgi:hypothetical protein
MSKRQIILEAAKSKFPGKFVRLRKLGGIDEVVVSDPRDPKFSLTITPQREIYTIVIQDNGFDFVKTK